jgi:hypothetical protein
MGIARRWKSQDAGMDIPLKKSSPSANNTHHFLHCLSRAFQASDSAEELGEIPREACRLALPPRVKLKSTTQEVKAAAHNLHRDLQHQEHTMLTTSFRT